MIDSGLLRHGAAMVLMAFAALLGVVGGAVVASTKASKSEVDARIRQSFASHFDLIWRTARRLGLSAAEADDAAQEVFVIFANKLASVDPDKERSFLFGTVLRVAANVRRALAVRRADGALDELVDPRPTADELLDGARARALLDHALASLPDDLREVLVLSELDELTSPAIAEILEVPLGTIASRLRRAREQFAKIAERMRTRVMVTS